MDVRVGVRRIFLSVIIVLLSTTLSFYIKMGLYIGSHFVVFLYTVTVRPFEELKDSIIESLQDLTFIIITFMHIIWDGESGWKPARVTLSLNVLMGSGLLIAGILLVFAAINIISAIISFFSAKKRAKKKLMRKSKFSSHTDVYKYDKTMTLPRNQLRSTDVSLKKLETYSDRI